MKVLNNFLQFGLLTILSIVVVSCSSDQTETEDANTTDVESTEINTRGAASKVSAKEFYYTDLAVFEDGFTDLGLEALAALKGKKS